MYGMVASGLIDIVIEDTLKVHDYMALVNVIEGCLLYTSPSPRDLSTSRMPSSA